MQNHEAWLKIAKIDLKAAQELFLLELFTKVTFETHQTAEKSLKAFLVFHKQPIIKTHDLIQLIELCLPFDQTLQCLFESAALLNPYSTRFRYPSEYEIPDTVDAAKAIAHATIIHNMVQ